MKRLDSFSDREAQQTAITGAVTSIVASLAVQFDLTKVTTRANAFFTMGRVAGRSPSALPPG